jgi:hypothetical protein
MLLIIALYIILQVSNMRIVPSQLQMLIYYTVYV